MINTQFYESLCYFTIETNRDNKETVEIILEKSNQWLAVTKVFGALSDSHPPITSSQFFSLCSGILGAVYSVATHDNHFIS